MQPIKIRDLKNIFDVTHEFYYSDKSKVNLLADVKNLLDKTMNAYDVEKVVDLYLEYANQTSVASGSNVEGIFERYVPSERRYETSNNYFSYNPWIWTTNNNYGTSNNQQGSSKQRSLEEILAEIAIGVGVVILGAIAAVSFGNLMSEFVNHSARMYHNEGWVEGAFLMLGMWASFSMAAYALYALAGNLLMATMTAAAFSNPAAWAAAVIVLGAVIATPLVNMFVREAIYGVFAFFDGQKLVDNDNRFRALTAAELDNLPSDVDPDRIHVATLMLYKTLKPTQVRQEYAFYDYNSEPMNDVLGGVRAMRTLNKSSDKAVSIKQLDDTEQEVSFSLKKVYAAQNETFFGKSDASSQPSAPVNPENAFIPLATAVPI